MLDESLHARFELDSRAAQQKIEEKVKLQMAFEKANEIKQFNMKLAVSLGIQTVMCFATI